MVYRMALKKVLQSSDFKNWLAKNDPTSVVLFKKALQSLSRNEQP
jgi:hypothetical protein